MTTIETTGPARGYLAELIARIRGGYTPKPGEFATAQAEADAEVVVEQHAAEGARERAKAAKELQKRQDAAKAAVRKVLPVVPEAELAAAVATVEAALGELVKARETYAAQIEASKETLRAGGVVENVPMENQDDVLDYETHGHDRRAAVTIDGTLFDVQPFNDALLQIARDALKASGADLSKRRQVAGF